MIGAVITAGMKILDKVIPDPVAKAEAQRRLIELEQAGELKELDAAMQVVVAEAKSEHALTAQWRPITMLTFVVLGCSPHARDARPALGPADCRPRRLCRRAQCGEVRQELEAAVNEAIDQLAHLVVGLVVTWALAYAVPEAWAFGLMMAAAVARELWQHRDRRMGPGSFLDLAFFAAGGLVALVLS